jgi:uncharacterized delta-60 repeat protein
MLLLAAVATGCDDDDSNGGPVDGGGGLDAAQVTPDVPGADTSGAGVDAPAVDGSPRDTGGGDAASAPATLIAAVVGKITAVDDVRGLTYGANGMLHGAGFKVVDGDRHLALVRIKADGTPDTAFGTAGVASHNIIAVASDTAAAGKGNEGSYGVVELANGSFIVQANANDGQGGQNVVLVKFTSAGAYDSTFGVVRVPFGWPDETQTLPGAKRPSDNAWGLVLDRSSGTEKVVVNGFGPARQGALKPDNSQRVDNDRYVVRLLASNGSLDTTFATGGIYTADADGAQLDDNARRALVQDDGAIVSTGYTEFANDNHVVLIRLLPNGTPDPNFGFGTLQPGASKFNPFVSVMGMAEAYAVGQQSSGRYVTTGYGVSNKALSKGNDLLAFGVLADKLDVNWGQSGSVVVRSEDDPTVMHPAGYLRPFRDNGRDLLVLSDDRTLHVGGYDNRPAMFLTKANGSLDTSFGQGGKLVYSSEYIEQQFHQVAASADGKRIAGITSGPGPNGLLIVILTLSQS